MLNALNKAWGTVFWGHSYTAWSQIPLPWNTRFGAHNPSLALDYDRSFSDSTDAYLKLQAGILWRTAPGKAITTNEMGMFSGVDYSPLNTSIDFVAWDNYPLFNQNQSDCFGPAFGHDLMRAFYDRLVARVAGRTDVALGPKLPAGVEMAMREKPGEEIIFLLNYTASSSPLHSAKSRTML